MGNTLSIAHGITSFWAPVGLDVALCPTQPSWKTDWGDGEPHGFDWLLFRPAHDFYQKIDPSDDYPSTGCRWGPETTGGHPDDQLHPRIRRQTDDVRPTRRTTSQ